MTTDRQWSNPSQHKDCCAYMQKDGLHLIIWYLIVHNFPVFLHQFSILCAQDLSLSIWHQAFGCFNFMRTAAVLGCCIVQDTADTAWESFSDTQFKQAFPSPLPFPVNCKYADSGARLLNFINRFHHKKEAHSLFDRCSGLQFRLSESLPTIWALCSRVWIQAISNSLPSKRKTKSSSSQRWEDVVLVFRFAGLLAKLKSDTKIKQFWHCKYIQHN